MSLVGLVLLAATVLGALVTGLPMFAFTGVLLNRLPVVGAMFRTSISVCPRSRSGPLLATIGLGALLQPFPRTHRPS